MQITDLDRFPPIWRKTINILLGKLVATQQMIDDSRDATDAAIDNVLAEAPVLRQAILDQRVENLKAKGTEFDAMDRFEFDAKLKAALNDALRAAVQSLEEERLESMPAS